MIIFRIRVFDWNVDSEQEILDVLGRELTIPIIGGTAADDGSFDKFSKFTKGRLLKIAVYLELLEEN